MDANGQITFSDELRRNLGLEAEMRFTLEVRNNDGIITFRSLNEDVQASGRATLERPIERRRD